MKSFRQLLCLVTIIFCSQLVKANNGKNDEKKSKDSVVHGYVMDAVTRKPVTGVTVSSGKLQNNKEMQSDDCGYFHFAKVPPGEVTMLFEKKGYKIYKRDVVSGKEGVITKVSVEVQPLKKDGGNESWHPLLKLLD